jgi:hypothetical protein
MFMTNSVPSNMKCFCLYRIPIGEKLRLDDAPCRNKHPQTMRSINNQFSLNRAASKRQFPISCLCVLLVSLLSLVILVVGAQPCSAADEILNNASVIQLQGLNLGDDIVIEKIKTSKCNFDTSADALQQLKEAKVSAAVILAMIKTQASATASTAPTATGDPNDPITPHAAGVWVLQETNGQKKMTRLESETPNQTKTGDAGSMWGAAWGGSMKTRVILSGSQAVLQSSERRPVFYLYFGGAGQNTAGEMQNPKEILLAQFEVKKNKDHSERLLVTGSMNAYSGTSFGVEQRAIRLFHSEMIVEGIYKVVPKQDLANGEYAFCTSMNILGQGRFFTFRIQSADAMNNPVDPEVEKICESLKAEKPDEVIQALKKLRGMNAPEAVPQILPCLNNSNPNVVRDACRTLAVLGDKSIIPSIEPLLKDSRKAVSKDAQNAIAKLQAKP